MTNHPTILNSKNCFTRIVGTRLGFHSKVIWQYDHAGCTIGRHPVCQRSYQSCSWDLHTSLFHNAGCEAFADFVLPHTDKSDELGIVTLMHAYIEK